MKNKKAQGEIITTVLIILLVLAAIVIVWQVVQSTVNKGAKQVESQSSCMGFNVDIVLANSTSNNVTITRKTGSDVVSINNFKFIIDGSVIKDVDRTNGGSLGVFETKTWTILPLKAVTTDTADGLKKGQKVEIAPILADGTQCSVIASANAVGDTGF